MGRHFLSILLLAAAASMASAQQGTFRYASDTDPADTASALEEGGTTESSSFSSYSKKLITARQKRAIAKADQRRLLIASRQWYGHSLARPVIPSNPYATGYVPFYPIVPVGVVLQAERPVRTYSGAYGWY